MDAIEMADVDTDARFSAVFALTTAMSGVTRALWINVDVCPSNSPVKIVVSIADDDELDDLKVTN